MDEMYEENKKRNGNHNVLCSANASKIESVSNHEIKVVAKIKLLKIKACFTVLIVLLLLLFLFVGILTKYWMIQFITRRQTTDLSAAFLLKPQKLNGRFGD